MASIIPLCLVPITNAIPGRAYSLPHIEARAGGSKFSGASGSDALILDDYSAEDEDVDGDGIQMTRKNIIIISVISGVSFILVIGSIFLFCWLRRSRKRKAARTSFSEDTQYVANSGSDEHHQELKTDEQQPLYPQHPAGLNHPVHHAHHGSHGSHISHASHDSTHDQHLSLLFAYDQPPPPYDNSPPNHYSPLQNHGVGNPEPSYPAPTATVNGLQDSIPLSGGEAEGYYGR